MFTTSEIPVFWFCFVSVMTRPLGRKCAENVSHLLGSPGQTLLLQEGDPRHFWAGLVPAP